MTQWLDLQVREKFLSLKKDTKVEVVTEAEEVVLGSFHLTAGVASNFKVIFLSLIILGFACLWFWHEIVSVKLYLCKFWSMLKLALREAIRKARRVILKLYRFEEFRKSFSPLVFVCCFCFSFFSSGSFVFGAFLRPRAESQFVVKRSLDLLWVSLCKCRHCHLWVVISNAFLGFPTAWEQPSRTKRGLLESLSRSGTFAWAGNCPFSWEHVNFHNAIRSAQLDRFSFLARCNASNRTSVTCFATFHRRSLYQL